MNFNGRLEYNSISYIRDYFSVHDTGGNRVLSSPARSQTWDLLVAIPGNLGVEW